MHRNPQKSVSRRSEPWGRSEVSYGWDFPSRTNRGRKYLLVINVYIHMYMMLPLFTGFKQK